MVMLPEVWAKTIDSLVTDGADLIILTPAGKKFNQKMAESFSTSSQLIFACGRYEGIDQRVFDWAKDKAEVRLISLGDYVLNGGEAAAIDWIEDNCAPLAPELAGVLHVTETLEA